MNEQTYTTRFERSNGYLLIHVSGEIDLSNSHQLQNELEGAVEHEATVVLDLAEVKYLDSQGLRLIKQFSDQIIRSGGDLRLIAPPDTFARQVFDMARMSDYIHIRDEL